MKVLHILYVSPPDVTGGSIRSRDVLRAQDQLGIHVLGLTSPFQPPLSAGEQEESIDGITYIRSFSGKTEEAATESRSSVLVQVRKGLRLYQFARLAAAQAAKWGAEIIHAHSSFFCGYAALWAGWQIGCPVVYEVRSLWEERRAHGNTFDRLSGRVIRSLETGAMRRADALITIGHRLKDEIVARGVPVDKITVVGNAISLTNRAESAWMFREPLRFGYVGNMSAFEGLFELLTAWSILEDSGARAQLHFHGTGKDETELRSLAHRLGLSTVTFHGRFEPSRATEVYETFDVVLNPRRSNRLSELVTPIKPLEAMYFGKLVMVSRVGGLLELISDGSTGIVIDGFEPQNIFEAVRNVLNMDRKKLEQIASKGQQWVVAERTWPNNAKPYIEMYARLLQSAR